MVITICSSMSFHQEITKVKKDLIELGHKVFVPVSTQDANQNPEHVYNDDYDYCIKNDVLNDHYGKMEKSDAILVLNYTKENIKNYIGGAVLGEILIAYYLKKKIYILNELPSKKDLRYVFEIQLTHPNILNGDLTNI